MDRTFRRVLAVGWMAAALGCGLNDPKYIDYTEEEDGGGEADGTDGTTECTAAIAAFDAQMSAVTNSCAISGCHLTQTISGKPLSSSDSKVNRTQLLAYTGTTSEKLFNKISAASGQTHAGGNLSAKLPQANIDAWLAEEANCP